MNPKSYQPQNNPSSNRVRCPVCREVVYSRAGIHPQCAVRQSDPPKPKNKPPEVPGEVDPIAADAALKLATGEVPASGV